MEKDHRSFWFLVYSCHISKSKLSQTSQIQNNLLNIKVLSNNEGKSGQTGSRGERRIYEEDFSSSLSGQKERMSQVFFLHVVDQDQELFGLILHVFQCGNQ